MRISARWRKMSSIYLYFARDIGGLDTSEEAARAAYLYESRGVKSDLTRNAYVIGKQWANVQVDEWKAGIAERLFLRSEFTSDPEIGWWADEVLP